MENKEKKVTKREKDLDKDTNDLIEYVKWITGDLGVLRDRVRIAEKIISDLRTTGEESVESLLNNLYEQSNFIQSLYANFQRGSKKKWIRKQIT